MADRAAVLVVFEAPGLTADAIADFYNESARSANRTQVTGESMATMAGESVRRLDTKTGERLQTVVVWPAADPDAVNVVITNDLPDGKIEAAVAAFGGSLTGLGAVLESPAMTDRREAWRRERLDPALARSPERKPRFSTISDLPIDGLYGPWSLGADAEERIGLPGEPPFTRGIHPTGYRSRLWTMRMFAGFGAAEDTNARFQPAAGRRPDGPVDRLRHADAVRLRHRRPRGRGRVRDVRRRGEQRSPTWRSCWTACRWTASARR